MTLLNFQANNENQIAIGAGVSIDLQKLLETRLMIQANSGGGKSSLMRLIIERAGNQIPFIVLDWEGEFITLREKLDVLIVGSDGEIPVDVRSASLLARKLIELRASAIIDLSDLIEPGKKREYAKRFLDSLISLPRNLWHQTFVFIDEAHQLCPEGGKAIECAQSVINLMSLGRKRSLCGILATQRLSKLHKDAVSECNNIFIGRTWLDIDQKRAADSLGIGSADKNKLRDLKEGEFFAFGSAMSYKGVQRWQADLPDTQPPKAGTRHALNLPKASDVVAHLVAQLADLPQKAQEEIKSLEAAKSRILELERELKSKPVSDFSQSDLQREKRLREETETVYRKLYDQHELLKAQYAGLAAKLNQINQLSTVGELKIKEISPLPKAQDAKRVLPMSTPLEKRQPVKSMGNGDAKLSGGERKILTVLAQYSQGRSKTQIAILAGYSHKGGAFNNYLSALRTKGFIHGAGERIEILDDGLLALGDYEPLPTGQQLLDYWMNQLGKAERESLQVLATNYPQALSKERLAQIAGYAASGGGFNNALSKLRTLELIEGRGELKASDVFFK